MKCVMSIFTFGRLYLYIYISINDLYFIQYIYIITLYGKFKVIKVNAINTNNSLIITYICIFIINNNEHTFLFK
jgi:hypothetical protein